jgi:hypothetical protein
MSPLTLYAFSGVEESELEQEGEDAFADVSGSKGRGQSDGSRTERGTVRERERDKPLSLLDDTSKRGAAAHAINKTGVLKRPFTADPSLGSQSGRAAIGSNRDMDRDSSCANVMEIHQGSDSSLSPLRNRSFRAKEESINELFPAVAVENERKALSVLDPPKMTRQEMHSDSGVSPGGYFEKRKPLNKVMKSVPRTKPRSAVPANRKQYLGSSPDHSKSAQFDFKKSVDDVHPGIHQRDLPSTFKGNSGSIVDEASSSKESKEFDTTDALLPHVTSSSIKEEDSTISEIHQ